MPELPRISGKEAVLAFERLGFRQVRQEGSHVVLRRDDRGCVVPLHSSLALGTLRSAIRQAGISVGEFVEAHAHK
ncbi:MAG: type II toxin-antitoxin system HicA family toxin [Sedimentisphaerales bacterium]|nr:type II toxin-antitoxin system HicA family toxin [Sedimentisphaerales bacterium]